jgi:SAM-dependent methyltransferase
VTSEFEKAYRERLAAGQTRWHPGDYDDFPMRPFLDRLRAASTLPLDACQALDVGCGTGQVACYLAAHGAKVTGIDISGSAVACATQMAQTRELDIEFLVGDLVAFPLPAQTYDLIVDCGFLHCIVDWGERGRVLRKLCAALRATGELWSETMVGVPEMPRGEGFYLDNAGVFWKALGSEDAPFSPIRRIHRDVSSLNGELEAAGFVILYQETEPPQDAYSVWMARTRAGVSPLAE